MKIKPHHIDVIVVAAIMGMVWLLVVSPWTALGIIAALTIGVLIDVLFEGRPL